MDPRDALVIALVAEFRDLHAQMQILAHREDAWLEQKAQLEKERETLNDQINETRKKIWAAITADSATV